ncbi:malonyl-CoA synthase [Ahrensia sp. R2A130]|uniref:malonate--CoA ligase n=1 Tax=Ahrensia sp. R2A130 TaxID=744979 RepID=UPI0001E0D8A4|nr:malonyl-CoA synthase [Ahrensia sp. R2A130]EFL87708.1 long-chain-fatty-acid--CoA ligase [Ahrensia sp. R2A130]
MTNHLFDQLLGEANAEVRLAFMPGAAWNSKDRSYSYGDALDVSARFAAMLVEQGVRPGDRVAVQVEKSIEAVMLYLATVRAGGVFLPLNTAYTAAEIEYFVTDASPAILVCDPRREAEMQPVADKAGARLLTMGVWAAEHDGRDGDAGTLFAATSKTADGFENLPRGPDDLAAILYTSGTTGRSKGAMLSHANLVSNAEVLAELWQFTSDDKLLHALPIFHTHGLFVATNVTLKAGGSMVFLPGFKPDDMLASLPDCTAMMGVPTFYTRLLADDRFTADSASHMRLFVSGSAPMLVETHQQFEALTGKRVLERYGMTETNMNTSNPFDGDRKIGTVGPALPGTEVRIVDAGSGEKLKTGEVGSIEIRGPNVFSGYWNMPEKTAEEFRDNGFFISGDLGTMDEDGYITIVGRSKDLVISGGYNIYPKEIESVLDDEPGVLESAVFGVPHPDFGEGLLAAVVPSNGEVDTTNLMAAMGEKLARFKQPKAIFVMEALPRNTMGKVQKNVLRNTHGDHFKS